MKSISSCRVIATIFAASCIAAQAPAWASGGSPPPTFKSDAAQSGSTGSLRSTDRTDAAQSGRDADNHSRATIAFPPADFRGGDMPAHHPGTGRAATAAPPTIEIVRPERTIVREVDETLPLILSSTALLLVLAGLARRLVHTHRRVGGLRSSASE